MATTLKAFSRELDEAALRLLPAGGDHEVCRDALARLGPLGRRVTSSGGGTEWLPVLCDVLYSLYRIETAANQAFSVSQFVRLAGPWK